MRKIINSAYVALDGVVEQPQLWPTIQRSSDERGGEIETNMLPACDAVNWSSIRARDWISSAVPSAAMLALTQRKGESTWAGS
jgi:hypothetical protein